MAGRQARALTVGRDEVHRALILGLLHRLLTTFSYLSIAVTVTVLTVPARVGVREAGGHYKVGLPLLGSTVSVWVGEELREVSVAVRVGVPALVSP